jgi:lysophospholipase L1-like esterase
MAGRNRETGMSRLWLAAPAILMLALGWAGIGFHQWRQGKLAQLEVPPAPPILAGSPADPPGLLLFGDSRIAQWAPLPARPYPVTTRGYPGATAIRLVPVFQAALAEHRPALVLLQLGANDAVAAALLPAPGRAKARADTLAAIDHMAAAASAGGAQIMILDIIPPVRTDPLRRLLFRDEVDRFVAEVNAALPAIAARHGAIHASAMLLLAPNGEVPDNFRKDWLHLTPAAYRALAPLLPESLEGPVPYSIAASTGRRGTAAATGCNWPIPKPSSSGRKPDTGPLPQPPGPPGRTPRR